MIRVVSAVLLALVAASVPAADPPPPAITFEDVTAKAGLVEPLAGIMGHGGAWGDFDGDGKPDLYVGGFADRPGAEYGPAGKPVPSVLLRNRGNGTFEPVADTPARLFGRTSGAVFADLDNDGRPELYVANNARGRERQRQGDVRAAASAKRSVLLWNDDGRLVDVSDASGAAPDTLLSARNVGVLDYDADGRLDLLVVEDRFTARPRTTLFRNEGGLKFGDVNEKVGLPDGLHGLGLAVADVNDDGRPDFFVPHANRLFLSAPGNTYREAKELADVFAWKPLHGEDWPCGACFADLNRDGRPDLVLALHSTKARNRVFLNDGLRGGVPRFRDVTAEVGLGDAVPVRCPHVEVQDFDNDGWPDIYLSAAYKDGDAVTPLVYRHTGLRDGLPRFVPPRPVSECNAYYPAGPSCDYDGDGRIDLSLVNWFRDDHSRLLRNTSPPRSWLDVRVTGKKTNRMGVGSKVWVYAARRLGEPDGLIGYQEIAVGYGYASGQLPVTHFGLGDAKAVDVRVTLPGGTDTIDRTGVSANRVLTVEE
jgi:hypothetical protein